MDILTNRQADRQTDRQTDIRQQVDRQDRKKVHGFVWYNVLLVIEEKHSSVIVDIKESKFGMAAFNTAAGNARGNVYTWHLSADRS